MTGAGSFGEKALNPAFGLSFLGWAVAGPIHAGEFSAVRLTVSALNATVGLLFILRTPALVHGSPRQVFVCLPSFVVAGAAWKLANRCGAPWPPHTQALLVCGGGWTIASFLFLARSFAIFPALRRVVTRGPYRFVRHPGYLGELAMVIACLLVAGGWSWLLLPAGLACIVPRVLAEEQVLSRSRRYRAYRRRVRYRLVPLLW